MTGSNIDQALPDESCAYTIVKRPPRPDPPAVVPVLTSVGIYADRFAEFGRRNKQHEKKAQVSLSFYFFTFTNKNRNSKIILNFW